MVKLKKEEVDALIVMRRHLHANPELSFEENKTAAFIRAKLEEVGITDIQPCAETGVVALIEGAHPGPTLAFRGDIDALPIIESSDAEYCSTNPGVMHACGHDVHTTLGLGVARALHARRDELHGTIKCIFQPAEEGGGGGNVMVQEGLMDRWGIDEVYGMHNMPGHPTGQFAIREGALLAAADEFAITLTGQGGHAAAPHEAVDTNLAAAHVMIALQSIASRNTDPLKQVVVSVCTLRSDTDSHNVLPHQVLLRGTVRTLDPEVQDLAERRLHDLTRLTAEAHQCRAEIDYQRGYPVTRNHADQTRFAAEAADKVTPGTDRDTPPIMAGEDFSYMLNARPGAYIMIGNGEGATVHHPEYDFDDAAIPAGCSWFAQVVEDRLARA